MKHYICLLLCAIIALSFCACSADTDDKESTDSDPATQAEAVAETTAASTKDESPLSITAAPTDTEKLKAFVRGFDRTPTVEKQVVFENDQLTVTVDKIEYDTIGPQLVFSVANLGDKDIIVTSSHAVINNKMINPKINDKITAGKTEKSTMTFLFFDLAISDIDRLETVEFILDIKDDTYKNLLKTDPITVTTSAEPTPADAAVTPEDEGQVAYDKDGVKIVVKGLNYDHTYDEVDALTYKLVVSITNDTQENQTVSTKELLVNGCEITRDLNCLVFPGKEATYYNRIFENDLSEYGITTIDSIKVSFAIKSPNCEKPIETDVISVDLSDAPDVSSTVPNYAGKKNKDAEKGTEEPQPTEE